MTTNLDCHAIRGKGGSELALTLAFGLLVNLMCAHIHIHIHLHLHLQHYIYIYLSVSVDPVSPEDTSTLELEEYWESKERGKRGEAQRR